MQDNIKQRYRAFFEIVDRITPLQHPLIRYAHLPYDQLKENIEESDNELISGWTGGVTKQHERMLGARIGEKLAMHFLRNLLPYANVKDVSIEQIAKPGSTTWKSADIEVSLVEKSVSVDVKTTVMSRNLMYYSNLFVKRFKEIWSEDVLICGVVVPPPSETKGQPSNHESTESRAKNEFPLVLGFLDKRTTKEIEKYFNANGILFSMHREQLKGNYLPHWIFDYGRTFYSHYHDALQAIRQLPVSELPSPEDWEHFPETVPLVIASGKPFPQEWYPHLKEWQRRLVDKLLLVFRFRDYISLPFVICAIIAHFIEQIQNGTEDFSPQEYLSFLSVQNYPLGIYDPLNTLENFVEFILKPLWNARSELHEYKIFSIDGLRLFKAKRNEAEIWTTLVAWCECCGYYPLVYGVEETCSTCRRLVCARETIRYANEKIYYPHKESWFYGEYEFPTCRYKDSPCPEGSLRILDNKFKSFIKFFQLNSEKSNTPEKALEFVGTLGIMRKELENLSPHLQDSHHEKLIKLNKNINKISFQILRSLVIKTFSVVPNDMHNLVEEISRLVDSDSGGDITRLNKAINDLEQKLRLYLEERS